MKNIIIFLSLLIFSAPAFGNTIVERIEKNANIQSVIEPKQTVEFEDEDSGPLAWDHFTCYTGLYNNVSKTSTNTINPFIVMRFSDGVESSTKLTHISGRVSGDHITYAFYAGNDLSINFGNQFFSIGFELFYQHYYKNTVARQSTCLAASKTLCTYKGDESECIKKSTFCNMSDSNTWSEVPVVNDLPTFDSSQLNFLNGSFKDRNGNELATYYVSCVHDSTHKL